MGCASAEYIGWLMCDQLLLIVLIKMVVMSELDDEQVLYEIVQLAEGEIGLCRAGDDEREHEPLLRIRFSEESQYFLESPTGDAPMLVAKAMIEAGLDAVQEMQLAADKEPQATSHLLH